MKLSTLAQETGVSTASIKYYIHVGILPPGRKRNATTADYAPAHVDRLALITCLRRELGSSIGSITALTRAIDDESLENIDLMGICQQLALEASNALSPGTASARPGDSDFEHDIRNVLKELGWPDISPTAVTSMADVLEELSASGYPVGRDTILRHIQALAEIAGRNTTPITDALSRDRICVEVIRGITMHNRLLLATSALAHASLSAMPRTSHENGPQTTNSV
ncbi:DNA-binding transcriptional regulator, MerR family [Brevibacterium sandarakinum]|uniref:DNA-binding transcriptional regulator, MerR family n=1 Tax=Brevibacterium sandarakinum TaxID=629680 RepID=A0A1H1UGM5_BRESA|nr:MerR family transcriptional regulator [Brevibacterium sandarakinum]SDS71588.1 DNA-binding transcriptional regulator, MerR family [Brevibacterium sandarakinum]